MRPKGAKGKSLSPQSQVGRKPQVGPPAPVLTMDPNPSILAKNPKDPIFDQGPPVASGKPQRPPAQHKSNLPLSSRGIFPIPPCTPYSRMQGGAYIVLYNILHQFWSPNPSPILKEDSSAHQSGNPWRLSEDHSRTPTTWPRASWVGNSFRIIPRANIRGYSSVNKSSRQKVLQYSLDNSIGPYRKQSINLNVIGPIGPILIPLWESNHTFQLSRWPGLYWPNSDNTAG
ncbi:hypothetical protein O181_049456 [Austropuccinia psidii MF-1]|uniref:Uncharacterized protein n=1 Tax=Austropuccinia psidii MF-1 TaxID=1389203 RepID=A0A9Q3HLD7_9BASI|nr:hypothetical protein [Austropuccinia psidii MF-1]